MVDYVIVGAGLYGAVCARELTDAGKRVLVVEKASNVGGMCHTERIDGVMVQQHGGHIYHTNDRRLWEYVQRFGEWRQYSHHVKARAGHEVWSLPINLGTLQQLFHTQLNPERGARLLASVCEPVADDSNVRDWCLSHIGPELYELFVKGYTEKQWGKPCEALPASIIKRLPVRLDWSDEYFSDRYQGMPVDGYTAVISEMLRGVTVLTGEDYLARCHYWDSQCRRVIYTGPIDALLGYQVGRLEYRSLRFEHETLPVEDYQGCPTMNYCDAEVPYTRIHEHKHWYPVNVPHTVITREYPASDGPAYYPVNDAPNQALYDTYRHLAAGFKQNVRVGGRLGGYIYRDMAPTIAAALKAVEQELA
jgi:UDP-galactopyranose mutase